MAGGCPGSGSRRWIPEWTRWWPGVFEDPKLRFDGKAGDQIIITHLREAARYADRTYLVENSLTGSKIRSLDGDTEDEVDAARLLTVLT